MSICLIICVCVWSSVIRRIIYRNIKRISSRRTRDVTPLNCFTCHSQRNELGLVSYQWSWLNCDVHARWMCFTSGLYFVRSVISSFLTWTKLSQDLLDRFSRSFHQMKGICVNFLDPDLLRLFVLSGVAVGCWQSFGVPSATAIAEA